MIADRATPAAIVRSAKNRSGTIGSDTRSSMAKKAAKPIAETTKATTAADAAAGIADPRDGEHERDERDREGDRAGEVEAPPGAGLDVRDREQGEAERREAERDVDPEHPRPAPVVGDGAAEHRTDEDRDREGGSDDAHVLRPLAGRRHVGDDRLRHQLEARRAHALRDPGDDELRHVLREPAGEGGHEEHDERRQEHEARADEVAELAEHGQQHGAREGVADDDPAHVLECAELAGDGGERRRDDRVIERAEDRDGQQRGDEEAEPERRKRHSCDRPNDRAVDATGLCPLRSVTARIGSGGIPTSCRF